jgi:hypothetical protein
MAGIQPVPPIAVVGPQWQIQEVKITVGGVLIVPKIMLNGVNLFEKMN